MEIVGDVADFGGKVERDLNNELRDVDVDVKPVAKQLADGMRKAGVQGAEDAKRGFSKVPALLGGLGKAAGKAFSIGLATTALASTLNTVAGLVVALAPAVGAIGPLAAGMIAAKIAAGTLQLALLGVSEAVGAGLTGDTAAFNEALEDMPKAAQTAIREIVSLKDQILGVRESVQGAFFEPLIGQLKPLGEALLPTITKQLTSIAQSFGTAAAASAKFLTLPTSVASVNTSLGYTAAAVENVAGGIPGMIRAFLPLWEVGSSFLPGLTAGFDAATQRMGAFLEQAAASGKLEQFFSAGLSALGDLGQLLGSVGSILMSVFQAASAAGGDLLGVLGQTVGQFAAFLNTAEGASALASVFQVLGQVAGIFGAAVSVVLPVIAQLVGVLAGALAPILPVISNLIQQLAPVVAQVGAALGSILAPVIGVVVQLLSTLVPVIMPIVQALMGALMPVITALAPVITALGQVISTILGAALTALMPVFIQLLPLISELLVGVLTPLVPVLALVGELFVALMPALVPLIQLIVTLVSVALKPLIAALPYVAAFTQLVIQAIIALVGPIAKAIGWVAQFLEKLLTTGMVKDAVVAAWNAIKSATSAVFGFVGRYITLQINLVKAIFRTIGGAVTAVIGFFNRARSGAVSALSAMRSAVASAVSAVVGYFGKLVSGATSKISSLISTVRGIGGRIKSAVGNLAGLLVAAGRAVIQGLINGITQKLGALRSIASKAAGTIRNLFPFSPAKEGPLSGRGSPALAGKKIATMIAAGLHERLPEVRTAALKVAETARLSTAPLDIGGHGILKAALGSAAYQSTPTLPPRTGGAVTSVTFGPGAVTLNFYGAKPSPDEAYAAAQAAGRGLASAFQNRDVRTTMRTI